MSGSDYRKRAIQEYGEVCHNCGEEEDILVHHRDGDRSNNELSNLIPLCSTCHGKVHGRSDEVAPLVRDLGYRPRSSSRTTIALSDTLVDQLYERMSRGESYEDVLWKIIGELEDE